MTKFSNKDDSVVVIIGSGAGGGTLGNELAQRGVKVVCLEAGKRVYVSDIKTNYAEMFNKLTWQDKRVGAGVLNKDFPAFICKVVGGTTMHWAGASLRFQKHEWQARTHYGEVDGANLLDWPVTHEDMEPYYHKAEDKMGVTGTHGIPRLPGNNNYRVLEYGARKVGYKQVHTGNMAINSQARDGRAACQQMGYCMSGCAMGAKWSTGYTEVPKAEATGNYEIRPESMVIKINHDASGKVTGVIYADKDGKVHEQKARLVAVAGNSIETPRLLLLSASSMFPNGLANSSDQVGRNYMPHVTGAIYARMPGEVHLDRGTQMAGIIMDEQGHDPSRGFGAGYFLETHPGFGIQGLANNMEPGAWGKDYAADLEAYRNMAGLWICGEDMPQEKNRVTLDDVVRDQFGQPVAHVYREDHPNDIRMREHAWKMSNALYEAAGASKVYARGPFSSTHNLGTCRQSAKASQGVCNGYGQTHDIRNLFISDGSQFTTSAAENPTLTIVALAIRQAEHIAGAMTRREL